MEPTISSKVVTGKRVAWWRGVLAQPGLAVYLFGSPPVLLAVLFHLAFHHAGMDGLSYTFWIGLAIVAAVGCFWLNFARTEGPPLEAECPACAKRSVWYLSGDHGQLCERCGVYVGVNGLEVRELALDAPGEFVVDRARYKKEVQRDERGHVVLKMPPVCAICSSAEASGRRTIELASSGGGSHELARQVSYFRTGSRGRVTSSYSDAERMDLGHVEVPVCERHTTSQPPPVRADNDGTLRFSSYAYYKAFCRANEVGPHS